MPTLGKLCLGILARKSGVPLGGAQIGAGIHQSFISSDPQEDQFGFPFPPYGDDPYDNFMLTLGWLSYEPEDE